MASSIYVMAAMCGCMRWESSLNPRIWESGIVATWDTVHYYDSQGRGVGGYGLGQWTNTVETGGIAWRLRDMYDWTVEEGLSMEDGNAQLRYILYEPYNGGHGIWFNVSHVGSNAQTLQEFLETDSTDLDGLTTDFLANWEGVPGNHLTERQAYAEEFLAYFREHSDDDPESYSWQSSNNYLLPVSETFNNAMCMYFFFNGYDPGPTPGQKSKKFMMWLKPRYKYFAARGGNE